MTDQSEMRTIAALAGACWRTDGGGRDILVEVLLSHLRESAPDVARIAASLLRARGDENGVQLGEALHEQLSEYRGDPFVIVEPQLRVDYLILTVKDVELTACLRAFGVPKGTRPVPLGGTLEAWVVEADGSRFAIAMVGTAGNVESAIVLGGLSALVESTAAVLVGMAAGVKERVTLGDVVVAEGVLAYEFQKMTDKGPILEPRPYSPPEWQIRNSTTLDQVSPQWREEVRRDVLAHIQADHWPDLDDRWRIHVRRGYVLAGGTLLEDGSLPDMATALHGRTLAAEMEGAGFAAACVEKRRPWLVVRGVADFGEPGRLKHWQFPATFAAARYLREALRHGRLSFTQPS